jgi:hypothetical protein
MRISILGLTGILFLAGCGQRAIVSADGLPLKRVVIYRNGVAYFERAGHVEEGEVRFKMKESEVGDFLATLAVLEKGGSSVQSAAFPLKDDEAEKKPDYKKTEDEKKGLRQVVLSLDGKAHDLEVGYVAEAPVWRPSYRLVIDKGSAYLQAWGIVQNLSGEDWHDVRLSLVAGAPLAFEAQLGEPVIPQRPVVTDQGEVIAAVPRGDTSLAQRPDRDGDGIPDDVDKCPDQPESYNGVDDEDGCPDRGRVSVTEDAPADAKAEQAAGGKKDVAKNRPAARGPMGGASRAATTPAAQPMPAPETPAPPPPPPPKPTAAPRNLRSLAAVAVEAGATRYDLPQPVTVPDKSATMVLLLSRDVPGEALFLFAPDGGVPDSSSHPFRVARFSNKTNGVLERGPIAVFEKGSFLGQGMLDPLPAGATATVPFALERALAVDVGYDSKELGERVATIENGELVIERDSVRLTKYKVRNGGNDDSKVLVRHPRIADARLVDPPKDTEDNVGTHTALVPAKVRAGTTTEVTVDERSSFKRHEDWFSPTADAAVKAYIADPRADKSVASKLTAAWLVRKDIVDRLDARHKLAIEQSNLEQQTQETRANLRAIEKNATAGDLRKKLTERLAATSTRLDDTQKKIVEIDAKLAELKIQFREGLRGVLVSGSLPVK